VAGTAIGNGRLLADNGRYVTYAYKDYRTDQIETRSCSGGEFVERLSLHIMPHGMQRVERLSSIVLRPNPTQLHGTCIGVQQELIKIPVD
jgi:hypothetical protein